MDFLITAGVIVGGIALGRFLRSKKTRIVFGAKPSAKAREASESLSKEMDKATKWPRRGMIAFCILAAPFFGVTTLATIGVYEVVLAGMDYLVTLYIKLAYGQKLKLV